MFFPYSLNLRLYKTPFATTLLGAICFLIFTLQILSEKQYLADTQSYCRHELTKEAKEIFKSLGSDSISGCVSFFIELDHSNDAQSELQRFYYDAQLNVEDEKTIDSEHKRFESIVQNNFTSEFWHNPLQKNYLSYFTSSLLHGDIEHLVFNLIFFFAFSIALEQTVGTILFILFFGLCCITTGISYEQGFLGATGGVLPTIGLSGVVSGIMGFCLVVYPLKKVKVFYWFFVLFGTINIPVLLVVAFFIASDLYGLKYLLNEDNINYVSHLSGSFTGIVFGGIYLAYKYFFPVTEST